MKEGETMKYSEAIKAALVNTEFKAMYDSFRKGQLCNGSLQFAIDGEAFYYGRETIIDEASGETVRKFRGGKHTPSRSAYLIGRGETFVIR